MTQVLGHGIIPVIFSVQIADFEISGVYAILRRTHSINCIHYLPIYTRVHTYINTYIYARARARTHTHTHTHTHTDLRPRNYNLVSCTGK